MKMIIVLVVIVVIVVGIMKTTIERGTIMNKIPATILMKTIIWCITASIVIVGRLIFDSNLVGHIILNSFS